MSGIQSAISTRAKKQENITQSEGKRSIKTDPTMTQMIVFKGCKGFKIAIVKYIPYVKEVKETCERDKDRYKDVK